MGLVGAPNPPPARRTRIRQVNGAPARLPGHTDARQVPHPIEQRAHGEKAGREISPTGHSPTATSTDVNSSLRGNERHRSLEGHRQDGATGGLRLPSSVGGPEPLSHCGESASTGKSALSGGPTIRDRGRGGPIADKTAQQHETYSFASPPSENRLTTCVHVDPLDPGLAAPLSVRRLPRRLVRTYVGTASAVRCSYTSITLQSRSLSPPGAKKSAEIFPAVLVG